MTDALIRLNIADGIARLVLNRPQKRNALTRSFIEQLRAAVRSVRDDEAVRLLVLAAEGPVFCAGMDLQEMEARAGQPDASAQWREDSEVYRDLLVELVTLNVPTLAIVGGAALAGGMGLVLACDMVLAAESAFFGLPEPKRGISAAVVMPLLLYRAGAGAASYLSLSGKNVDAREARRLGICHEVVAANQLKSREEELCRSILTGSRQALAITKKHLFECAGATILEQIDSGMIVSAEARETDDAREGLAAFLSKRAPAWVPTID